MASAELARITRGHQVIQVVVSATLKWQEVIDGGSEYCEPEMAIFVSRAPSGSFGEFCCERLLRFFHNHPGPAESAAIPVTS
jgi:hypothetical protein